MRTARSARESHQHLDDFATNLRRMLAAMPRPAEPRKGHRLTTITAPIGVPVRVWVALERGQCSECGIDRPAAFRLPPDGKTILCRECYWTRKKVTASYPDCPECLHPYGLMRYPDGWGFRCLTCGLKFTREAAARALEQKRKENPHLMSMEQWRSVQSSNLAQVAYDPDTRTMGVRFLNGGSGEYSDVSHEQYEALVTAQSPGGYLAKNIKSNPKVHKWTRT